MKKIVLFIMLLCLVVNAQQINYVLGKHATSGDAWKLSEITYLDTATTYDFIIDLNDYYFWDYNPLVVTEVMTAPKADSMITTSTVQNSSRYMYIGTFYCYFDVVKAADSIIFKIDAFPGIYGLDNKSDATIVWGDTVELEAVRTIGDYFSSNNVYIESGDYKVLPPEVIRIRLRDVVDGDQDDSIAFDWRFAYPGIIRTVQERKPSNR